MEVVFDIGMYDGADTAYYLECGYQVIAVEANPELAHRAEERFAAQIASRQLTCVNAGISPNGEPVELTLCATDLGSSTLFPDRVSKEGRVAAITVPGVTVDQLFERYGVPKYLKIDIEGADRFCILRLTPDRRPAFVSFEIGADVDELLAHMLSVGYNRFKIMNQNAFREYANLACLYDRVTLRLMRSMGYAEPDMVRRAGRFFVRGRSSGPVPWHGDGRWRSGDATRSLLRETDLFGWSDIHATIE